MYSGDGFGGCKVRILAQGEHHGKLAQLYQDSQELPGAFEVVLEEYWGYQGSAPTLHIKYDDLEMLDKKQEPTPYTGPSQEEQDWEEDRLHGRLDD